jgi:hypothetical protein
VQTRGLDAAANAVERHAEAAPLLTMVSPRRQYVGPAPAGTPGRSTVRGQTIGEDESAGRVRRRHRPTGRTRGSRCQEPVTVERKAALPKGTAFIYVDSREALLLAVAERVGELHHAGKPRSTPAVRRPTRETNTTQSGTCPCIFQATRQAPAPSFG